MAKKKEDIKVKVVLTDGYRQRFTEAYMKVLVAREKKELLTPPADVRIVQKCS
ncbi:MAG: hypothetical protein K1W06_07410 [Lachnospiraceae bacterium]